MPINVWNNVRVEILKYFAAHQTPVQMADMANALRSQNNDLKDLRNADFRHVVQPMIATGTLSYAPGLKIQLAKTQQSLGA